MSLPKWFGKGQVNNISVKKKSMAREKALAKNLGMRTTPGSGAFASHLADIYGEGFRIEHKMTDKKSISLKLEWIEKIKKEAGVKGEIPVIAIEIQGHTFFLVDGLQFQILLEVQKED